MVSCPCPVRAPTRRSQNPLLWIFLILFLMFFGVISIVIWTLKTGISPMPTSRKAKARMLEAFPQKIEGKIVELGSGWGTLAFPLAKRYPHCTVIGYELSPLPYLFSKLRHYFQPLPNLKIYRKDFYYIHLNDASLVVCYLFPGAMHSLRTKFDKELPRNAWVVTNTFAVPGWKPDKILTVNDLYHSKIYVYRFDFIV